MNTNRLVLIAVFLVFVGLTTPLYADCDEPIFDNGNIDGVSNNPTSDTIFRITKPYYISFIQTYHWNYGNGDEPGTIALHHSDGTIYGPWKAKSSAFWGKTGNGEGKPLYQYVQPFETIKTGTYTVVCSNHDTWSHNAKSHNAGMVQVCGSESKSHSDCEGSVFHAIVLNENAALGKTSEFDFVLMSPDEVIRLSTDYKGSPLTDEEKDQVIMIGYCNRFDPLNMDVCSAINAAVPKDCFEKHGKGELLVMYHGLYTEYDINDGTIEYQATYDHGYDRQIIVEREARSLVGTNPMNTWQRPS